MRLFLFNELGSAEQKSAEHCSFRSAKETGVHLSDNLSHVQRLVNN